MILIFAALKGITVCSTLMLASYKIEEFELIKSAATRAKISILYPEVKSYARDIISDVTKDIISSAIILMQDDYRTIMRIEDLTYAINVWHRTRMINTELAIQKDYLLLSDPSFPFQVDQLNLQQLDDSESDEEYQPSETDSYTSLSSDEEYVDENEDLDLEYTGEDENDNNLNDYSNQIEQPNVAIQTTIYNEDGLISDESREINLDLEFENLSQQKPQSSQSRRRSNGSEAVSDLSASDISPASSAASASSQSFHNLSQLAYQQLLKKLSINYRQLIISEYGVITGSSGNFKSQVLTSERFSIECAQLICKFLFDQLYLSFTANSMR